MTDEQYIVHLWLSRMWGKEDLITSKIEQRDKLIGWGVGTYDANHIPSGSDQNTSENKFIEYSVLSGEIDKSIQEYLREMRRTEDVIEKAKNSFQSALLYAWYINNNHIHGERCRCRPRRTFGTYCICSRLLFRRNTLLLSSVPLNTFVGNSSGAYSCGYYDDRTY